MGAVYKFLRHHYVLKRSVVFLIDSNFDSMANRERALAIVSSFFDSMSPTDSFGLLHIGPSKLSDFILEAKGKNTSTKRAILDEMMDVSKQAWEKRGLANEKTSLDEALEQALDWQDRFVPNEDIEINGHTYHGPQKWIVCLTGNDRYDVQRFMLHESGSALAEKKNLSVSIMGLSNEPF